MYVPTARMLRRLTTAEESVSATELVTRIKDVTHASTQCVAAYSAWEEESSPNRLRDWWDAAEAYYKAAKVAVEEAKSLPPSKCDILYILQDARDEAFGEMSAVIEELKDAVVSCADEDPIEINE